MSNIQHVLLLLAIFLFIIGVFLWWYFGDRYQDKRPTIVICEDNGFIGVVLFEDYVAGLKKYLADKRSFTTRQNNSWHEPMGYRVAIPKKTFIFVKKNELDLYKALASRCCVVIKGHFHFGVACGTGAEAFQYILKEQAPQLTTA